jgi:2OG-Fe(II) oxygenase superfamily
MSIHEMKDSIYIIKDVFLSEHGKCDEIVTFIKENIYLHQYIEVNPLKKNNVECTFIRINDNTDNEYIARLDDYIKNKIGDIIKLVISQNPFFPHNVFDNGYTLRQIHGGTIIHVDGIIENSNSTSNPRLLSIIINLNDDYEGGEFHFPKQDIKIRLKKGEAICFPPYWTHPHEVSSVSFGEYRYTINTWILQ